MIKTKKKGLLIVLSGPSGVGKDTVSDAVLKENPNLWKSISMTTRSPRKNEVEGKDYYFVSEEEFQKRIQEDKFLEYATFNHHFYGTPKDKVAEKLNEGKDVILVIDIQGALQIKEQIKQALFIFLLPPSMDVLKKRLTKRNTDSAYAIDERFKTAYQEINELPKYHYVIVNDTVEASSKKLNAILISERCRVDRIEELYLDTIEEKVHEKLVDHKKLENSEINIDL